MKKAVFKLAISILGLISMSHGAFSQTYDWSGYTAGSTSYTTGIMTATITSSSPGFQNSAPKYYAGTTVGGGSCGIAGGLAFENFFGNITTAHVTMVMAFTSAATTNGTCASMSFQIKDINSDESLQTFADWVEISAIDGNGSAIAVANITASGGSNKVFTTSGNTRIIKGYNSSGYGSRSTTSCDNVTVTVTPPAGVPLRSITLKYHPDYTACASCYYNFTGPNRPAYQYISIGPITATATGGGCTVGLPIALASFKGKCENNRQVFEWTTASETSNDYFTIEGSSDGELYEALEKVKAAGNSTSLKKYRASLQEAADYKYFRLKQTDFDNKFTYSDIISLDCKTVESGNIRLYPNPAENMVTLEFDAHYTSGINVSLLDVSGRIIKNFDRDVEKNGSSLEMDISALAQGIYYLKILDKESLLQKQVRFVKN